MISAEALVKIDEMTGTCRRLVDEKPLNLRITDEASIGMEISVLLVLKSMQDRGCMSWRFPEKGVVVRKSINNSGDISFRITRESIEGNITERLEGKAR